MNDTPSDPSIDDNGEKKISGLVKEVSAFFHREVKKKRDVTPPLSHFKTRVSKHGLKNEKNKK